MKARSVCVVLGTGGTIAGRSVDAADNVGYVAGEVGVGDLVKAVPPLQGLALECEQVAQIDSKDMGFAVWKRLAERVAHHLAREEVQGVVVTHGTDTLEETAWFLQTVLAPDKPVVLTSAMRPATALVPDGPQNLLDAVVVAGCDGLTGVVAVSAGWVHRAEHVCKVHSYRIDAFDSGDAGPMGCVEEGVVRWFQPFEAPSTGLSGPTDRLARISAATALPSVVLVTSHSDADGRVVLGVLALNSGQHGAKTQGIVVACTGNGTLHAELAAALDQAQASGVRVVRATRCARGRVISHVGDKFESSAGLSPVKARLALSLALLPDWA
ncbi:L-asparaginase [Hydrogenophaga crassostreae]|uniref:L-asparaginase n=1 Tax=Hydrogenophaga crassostreae TaxID=1763535 RepID=A0A167HZ15_9BURK|nr:L-asparaginase [Hydrogenophaga crassostreae]OAD41922.1 L-asparaginase [Hydrogenophaga crassostreae]